MSGAWQLVYGSGMTYRYALTDDGDIGGTVDFVYLGTPSGSPVPVSGTRDGNHVELDHRGPSAARGGEFQLHYVLTLSADGQRMTGYGEHSSGPEPNVVLSRPAM